METAVVAVGGNALVPPSGKGTVEEQTKILQESISYLKPLVRSFSLVMTHGNGPQIGNLLIQQESSMDIIPKMPIDTLDAMTQGQIGYWIQMAVEKILKKKAVVMLTRVLVDRKDSAFRNPTKPIGPYYAEKVFRHMGKEPEGWRRLVPSPKPIRIVDIEVIKSLLEKGYVVIACGGGGIPLMKDSRGLIGVEGVIDKDYTTARLAIQLKAEVMIFLTDVAHVYTNYGRRDQKPIFSLSIDEAHRLLKSEELKEGSMKPKIEASLSFLENGGNKVIITSPGEILGALQGKSGTVVA